MAYGSSGGSNPRSTNIHNPRAHEMNVSRSIRLTMQVTTSKGLVKAVKGSVQIYVWRTASYFVAETIKQQENNYIQH